MQRLERLLAIALFLSNRRRVLARDVAAHFDVSVRTVYRDVRALVVAGFPVEGNAGDGYRVAQSSFLRPLALTEDEAEVLTLAATAFGASVQAGMRSTLAAATLKLEGVLERPARTRLAELRRTVVVSNESTLVGPTTEVLDALHERACARIAYDDTRTGTRTTRTIEPLGLICLGAAWWLVAYCRLRRDARAFRLDRIAAWKKGPRFEPRRGLSLAEIIARDSHMAAEIFAPDNTLSRPAPPSAHGKHLRNRRTPLARVDQDVERRDRARARPRR